LKWSMGRAVYLRKGEKARREALPAEQLSSSLIKGLTRGEGQREGNNGGGCSHHYGKGGKKKSQNGKRNLKIPSPFRRTPQ